MVLGIKTCDVVIYPLVLPLPVLHEVTDLVNGVGGIIPAHVIVHPLDEVGVPGSAFELVGTDGVHHLAPDVSLLG